MEVQRGDEEVGCELGDVSEGDCRLGSGLAGARVRGKWGGGGTRRTRMKLVVESSARELLTITTVAPCRDAASKPLTG